MYSKRYSYSHQDVPVAALKSVIEETFGGKNIRTTKCNLRLPNDDKSFTKTLL